MIPWIMGGLTVWTVGATVLALRYLVLRHSLRQITDDLREGRDVTTNVGLSVSTADASLCELAIEINATLRALRAERRRRQQGDAELQAAVTNISHDLRTPLTAISGHLDLLEAEPQSPEAQRHWRVIRERTNVLRALTEELFRYSVIVSTLDELHCEPIALNAALEVSLAAFYDRFTARGIAPCVEMPDETVIRMVDGAALQRILGNILSNAAKYSDGDLSITLRADGHMVFCNRAHALGTVEVNRLFDRFYTVQSGRNATGLGLSIARMLTEKMGGAVSADYQNGTLRIDLYFSEKR